jgi:hypothetical protein
MQSEVLQKKRITTLKELNLPTAGRLQSFIKVQLFQSCCTFLSFSASFTDGYSKFNAFSVTKIPKPISVVYITVVAHLTTVILLYLLLNTICISNQFKCCPEKRMCIIAFLRKQISDFRLLQCLTFSHACF